MFWRSIKPAQGKGDLIDVSSSGGRPVELARLVAKGFQEPLKVGDGLGHCPNRMIGQAKIIVGQGPGRWCGQNLDCCLKLQYGLFWVAEEEECCPFVVMD